MTTTSKVVTNGLDQFKNKHATEKHHRKKKLTATTDIEAKDVAVSINL